MMEAARQDIQRLPLRRPPSPAGELEQLRPLGEAFLLRRFGGQIGRADAEDAVAEVVIRLHRKIENGERPRNLRAAFFTSVRNAGIDQLRSRAARPTTALEAVAEAPTLDATPPELAAGHEDAVRLQEALGRMRANYRQAILLRFGLGLTVPEIAARLDVSLPAAKKLVLRATEQARKRLTSIEEAEFCPEMRDLVRRRLFDKEAAELASASEQRILRAHVSHCGSCKAFLAELRHDLHEVGGAMLLLGGAGAGVDHHVGIADHLARLFGHASDAVQSAASRLRFAAFKASGAFQPGDATGAGVLSGTAQKALAVCGAATATTATCLATGLVGPGIGALDHHAVSAEKAPPPIVRQLSEESAPPAVVPEAEPQAPEPEAQQPAGEAESPAAQSEAAEVTPPAEPAAEEFGFESSASASSSTPAAPEPTPPAPSPTSTPSGGGGGGGGGESFGFGG